MPEIQIKKYAGTAVTGDKKFDAKVRIKVERTAVGGVKSSLKIPFCQLKIVNDAIIRHFADVMVLSGDCGGVCGGVSLAVFRFVSQEKITIFVTEMKNTEKKM